MTPDPSDADEQALLRRYRDASAAGDVRPLDATRAAILTEARRIAAEQAQPATLKPFDTRQAAANQARWRLAAFGTLGVAVFAALLMVPAYHQPPPPPAALSAARAPVTGDLVYAQPPRSVTDQAPAPAEAPSAPVRPASPLTARRQAQESVADAAKSPRLEKHRDADTSPAAAGAASPEDAPAAQARLAERASAAPAANAARSTAERGAPAPLLQAVATGSLVRVAQLLEHGASLRESDDAGRSALFLAVMQRRADLVRLLLARGADPSMADRAGQTPLEWARQHDAEDMVLLLSPPLATH